MLPSDLGVLLLLQTLLAPPKGVPLTSLYFVFQRSQRLLGGTSLFFDEFSSVGEGEAEKRHEVVEDGGAFGGEAFPDDGDKGTEGASEGLNVRLGLVLLPLGF